MLSTNPALFLLHDAFLLIIRYPYDMPKNKIVEYATLFSIMMVIFKDEIKILKKESRIKILRQKMMQKEVKATLFAFNALP